MEYRLLLLNAKTPAKQVAQIKAKTFALTHKFHFLKGKHDEFTCKCCIFCIFDLSFASNTGQGFELCSQLPVCCMLVYPLHMSRRLKPKAGSSPQPWVSWSEAWFDATGMGSGDQVSEPFMYEMTLQCFPVSPKFMMCLLVVQNVKLIWTNIYLGMVLFLFTILCYVCFLAFFSYVVSLNAWSYCRLLCFMTNKVFLHAWLMIDGLCLIVQLSRTILCIFSNYIHQPYTVQNAYDWQIY